MGIGRSKWLTSKHAVPFMLGDFNKLEILNLSTSKSIVVSQLMPILKRLYLSNNFKEKIDIIFSSQRRSLSIASKSCANYCKKKYALHPWIFGTMTSTLIFEVAPQISVIADGKNIVSEAVSKAQLIIALINTNQKNVNLITYPILGNTSHKTLPLFFLFLLANTVSSYEKKFFLINS